ncbi:MAG: DUF1674 domain-containing protein [Gammaproteobacteria bacterium]|nr:DUF1674 domain-containing protein [Gammaproteobacteria bacterium]
MQQDNVEIDHSSELNSKDRQEHDISDEDQPLPKETGGPSGLEPTRYGDWERKGRCIDF